MSTVNTNDALMKINHLVQLDYNNIYIAISAPPGIRTNLSYDAENC